MTEVTQETLEPAHTEQEEKLLKAYAHIPKIRSNSARAAFMDKFLPQMEESLGLVNFIGDAVKEAIKEDHEQATNIVGLMREAQRRMKANEADGKAFAPEHPEPPPARVPFAPVEEKPASRKVMLAVEKIKEKLKGRALGEDAAHIIRAILSDSFEPEEIQQVMHLLGV